MPTPELIAELHTLVRSGTYQEVVRAMDAASHKCHTQNLGVLYMAVETATGNTLIHTALLVQRIDILDVLRHIRKRNVAAFYRSFYALFSHQNHCGDTILHSAVRSGKLELVQAALQVFNHLHLDEAEEMLQEAEGARGNRSYYYYDDEDAISMRLGELMFLLLQNNEGRTAADEARPSGYADVVSWLDRHTKSCDPHGQRFEEFNVQLWRESTDEYYGRP